MIEGKLLVPKNFTERLYQPPKEVLRAAEISLDHTARDVRDEVKVEMERVFDNPTRWTLNSLKITPTRNHNLEAWVWFKEPERMGEHYLVPQVHGGQRRLKGFERALGGKKLIPGKGGRLNKAGNVSIGQIRQLLSVLGKAELTAGYSANKTSRSAKKNTRERDYVVIPKQHGKLLPGVYQRTKTSGGFGAKTKRHFTDRSKSYQKGQKRGRFSSVIRARGLKPILLQGKQSAPVAPRLDFFGVADRVYGKRYPVHFGRELSKRLAK